MRGEGSLMPSASNRLETGGCSCEARARPNTCTWGCARRVRESTSYDTSYRHLGYNEIRVGGSYGTDIILSDCCWA